jgi:hypothetical protein
MRESGIVALGGPDDEIAIGLARAFEAHGLRVHRLYEDAEWPCALDLVLFYGPFRPIGHLIRRLESLNPRPAAVLWNTEGLPDPRLPLPIVKLLAWIQCLPVMGRIIHARRIAIVGEMLAIQRAAPRSLHAGITPNRHAYFERLGVRSVYVPFGYIDAFGHPMGLARDIDVIFLGSTRDRRRAPLIAALEREFTRRGITFVIKDGSESRGHVYGEQRAHILNRARIMLNLMRCPWDDAYFRLLLAAPNGAMVLSEPTPVNEPFQVGEHIVCAPLDQIADRVAYYLAHEAERARIAESAYQYVINNLSMPQMVGQLLNGLD